MAVEITNRTSYPWDTVVYVSVTYVDKQTGRAVPLTDPQSGLLSSGWHGTGVLVGRNDVLTAAHVVQPPAWLDTLRYGLKIQVYPGLDNSPFSAPFGAYTAVSWDNYTVATANGKISLEQSQHDFALLALGEALGDRLGWMGLDPANRNSTGSANETGYPGSGPGMMNASVSYLGDFQYAVYHTTEDLGEGSSGGPLWYANSTGTYVLGVASSGNPTSANYASLAAPGVMDWLTKAIAANDTAMSTATGNIIALQWRGAFVSTSVAVNASNKTTALDDVISAASSYLPVSMLDGGGGSDTLKVSGGGALDLTGITGVEVLDLRDTTVANTVTGMGADFSTVYLGGRGDTVRIAASTATVIGGEGNDTITVGPGRVVIDGGDGTDTVVLPLARSAYQLTTGGSTPTSPPTSGSSYTMTNIERLQFADTKVALDLSPHASGGKTVEMLGAAFGKTALSNAALVGLGLTLFDANTTLAEAGRLALQSTLFQSLTGGSGNAEFVDTVYRNVMGEAPSATVKAYFMSLLAGSGGTQSQADLLVYAATSEANHATINLIGLQQTGVVYS